MKNKILLVVIVLTILIGQLMAEDGSINYDNPKFWSLLYPLPIPTQFGAYYTLLEEEDTVTQQAAQIVPFINLEYGRLYNMTRSYSFQLRPSFATSTDTTGEGTLTPYLHAFVNHRWHFLKDVASYEDLNSIILGVGVGGYAVTDKKDKYIFGPAVNFKLTGWWFTKLRGVFEIDATVGLIDGKEKQTDTRNLLDIIKIAFGQTVKDSAGVKLTAPSIINKKATNIGVTLGFWAPLDWSWVFPED